MENLNGTQPCPRRSTLPLWGLAWGPSSSRCGRSTPHTNCYAICQRNKERLNAVGDYFGVKQRYTDFAALLKRR